jgi:dihydrofolate reductase
MRNLASFIIVSLDGFHEDSNGTFDFPIVDEEFREFAIRQLDEADTLGFGRTTYEHMAAYWPTDQARANDDAIATRMNTKPKLVFSNTVEHAEWFNTTVIAGNSIERIEEIKSAPGEKCSSSLAPTSPLASSQRTYLTSCASWSAQSSLVKVTSYLRI